MEDLSERLEEFLESGVSRATEWVEWPGWSGAPYAGPQHREAAREEKDALRLRPEWPSQASQQSAFSPLRRRTISRS